MAQQAGSAQPTALIIDHVLLYPLFSGNVLEPASPARAIMLGSG